MALINYHNDFALISLRMEGKSHMRHASDFIICTF